MEPMNSSEDFNTKYKKLKFSFWEWEDMRDFFFLIGGMAQFQSGITRGSVIHDYKNIVMALAKSMWNIQDYASKRSFDPVAMESRVIVEAVCTYVLGERPINLGEAVHKISQIHQMLSSPLRLLKNFGCTSVHLENFITNTQISRTDENTALAIIQTVFEVLIIIRDDIVHNHKIDTNHALKNLYEHRKRLSQDRMSLESRNINKKKSCADESKPAGCIRCNMGCPYLHRTDYEFDPNDSRKNLEMINEFKLKKLRKKAKSTQLLQDFESGPDFESGSYIKSTSPNHTEILTLEQIEREMGINKIKRDSLNSESDTADIPVIPDVSMDFESKEIKIDQFYPSHLFKKSVKKVNIESQVDNVTTKIINIIRTSNKSELSDLFRYEYKTEREEIDLIPELFRMQSDTTRYDSPPSERKTKTTNETITPIKTRYINLTKEKLFS